MIFTSTTHAWMDNEWKNIGYIEDQRGLYDRADVDVPNVGWWLTGGIYRTLYIFYSRKTGILLPDTLTWEVGPELPVELAKHCSVQIDDVTTLIIGGENEENLLGHKHVWAYNWESKDWSEENPLKQGRVWMGCGVDPVSQNVIVAGGMGSQNAPPKKELEKLKSVEIYDKLTKTWSEGHDLPIAISQPRFTSNLTSLILIGGLTDNDLMDEVYMYTPNQWVLIDHMNKKRGSHVAMFIPDTIANLC